MKSRVAGGAVAALAGFALVAGGVSPLGENYGFVGLVGVVALLMGTADAVLRGIDGGDRADTPDVEVGRRVPVPGDGFDADAAADVVAVRSRLRARTVASLRRERDCTRAAAERLVNRGTWTSDPVAAAFLGADAPRPPLADRLRAAVSGRSRTAYRARRTVAALATLRDREGST